MRGHLAGRRIRLLLLVGAAILTAPAVTLGLAWLAHEALLLTVGQDAIQTRGLREELIAAACDGAGLISALAVLVAGWRHFVRGRG